MKKFKSKKHVKIKYKNILLSIIITTLILLILKSILTLKILKLNPVKTLQYSNIYSKKNIKSELTSLANQILKIDINKPTTILKHMMIYESPNIEQNEYYSVKQPENKEPLVYIYNTHQKEEYIGNDITPQPTVLTAAYYLKEKLEKLNIPTLVEETNIGDILKNNN